MNDYQNELDTIKNELNTYLNSTFVDPSIDYQTNKNIKVKLKVLIEKIIEDYKNKKIEQQQRDTLISKAMLILGNATGCAEDLEIADEILDALYDKGYLTTEDLHVFKDNSNTGRWE